MHINVYRSTELEVRGITLLENFPWGSVTQSLRVLERSLRTIDLKSSEGLWGSLGQPGQESLLEHTRNSAQQMLSFLASKISE